VFGHSRDCASHERLRRALELLPIVKIHQDLGSRRLRLGGRRLPARHRSKVVGQNDEFPISIADRAAIGHGRDDLHLQAKVICWIVRLEIDVMVQNWIAAPHDSFSPRSTTGRVVRDRPFRTIRFHSPDLVVQKTCQEQVYSYLRFRQNPISRHGLEAAVAPEKRPDPLEILPGPLSTLSL